MQVRNAFDTAYENVSRIASAHERLSATTEALPSVHVLRLMQMISELRTQTDQAFSEDLTQRSLEVRDGVQQRTLDQPTETEEAVMD